MAAHSVTFKWQGKWNLVHLNVKPGESFTDICDRIEQMGFYGMDRGTYTGFSRIANAESFMRDRMAELS